MIENCPDFWKTCVDRNDSIACSLLKTIDRYEQFAIMHSQDSALLHRIFNTAIINEDFEICQVIAELLEERKIMSRIS